MIQFRAIGTLSKRADGEPAFRVNSIRAIHVTVRANPSICRILTVRRPIT
jgi:hypothetical protein